jgi:hypothetical protein
MGGSKGVCPLGRRAKPEKGRQRAKRTLEGGSQFPLQGVGGENQRAEEPACLTVSLSRFTLLWGCPKPTWAQPSLSGLVSLYV